ncbi:hypothetical protein Hte_008587 [Hypoxylon texense]
MGSKGELNAETWSSKAAAKRASTLAKIYPQWRLAPEDIRKASTQRKLTGSFIRQFITTDDASILSMDSVPLVDAIKGGKLTSLQVTTAFCKAAAVAHQIGNCLHEIFFDEALERAKQLDEYYSEHGTTVGPLHGLPVSLKDQFHVKGQDTTAGYVGWIGSNAGIKDPSQAHQVQSQIATELRSLGAVLYCKTSVPQTLFFIETKNNIIGQTLNPNNQNLSCGGSSGGEGALLALRGSTIGVGTDIGGSVRIPAAFNGVFGIKPTPERFSYRDVSITNPGQNAYKMNIGFLSTSIDGIGLMLKSVLSTKPWLRDPAVVPMPFRQEIVDEYLGRAHDDGTAKHGHTPFKLGVMWSDDVVGPHPPITRGLRMVADAVKEAGHKVVNWEPPSHRAAKSIHLAIITADGAGDVHKNLNLSGEPLIPELDTRGMRLRPPMGLLKFQDLTRQGLELEERYSDYWNSTADDDDYTEALNLMNYSVMVIPVTKADKNLDPFDHGYRPLNTKDEKNWKACKQLQLLQAYISTHASMKILIFCPDDPEVYDGGPVGVQIVARKFEEEKVWAIAKVVRAALKRAGSPELNLKEDSDVRVLARL